MLYLVIAEPTTTSYFQCHNTRNKTVERSIFKRNAFDKECCLIGYNSISFPATYPVHPKHALDPIQTKALFNSNNNKRNRSLRNESTANKIKRSVFKSKEIDGRWCLKRLQSPDRFSAQSVH